ncbi:unnamed protein product [Strongylus vulgaris]|uniref:Uncharacterized protein n=1 Tax=Strongylus vulgaris TaxID=40348 RepID=A0A3P7I9E8_STRVU|nr:unnamed protein product [Strongylus vulgaris]
MRLAILQSSFTERIIIIMVTKGGDPNEVKEHLDWLKQRAKIIVLGIGDDAKNLEGYTNQPQTITIKEWNAESKELMVYEAVGFSGLDKDLDMANNFSNVESDFLGPRQSRKQG